MLNNVMHIVESQKDVHKNNKNAEKTLVGLKRLHKDSKHKLLSVTQRLQTTKQLQTNLDTINNDLFNIQVKDKYFVMLFALAFASSTVITTSSMKEWIQLSDKYMKGSKALGSTCEEHKNILEREKARLMYYRELFDKLLRKEIKPELEKTETKQNSSLTRRLTRRLVDHVKKQAVTKSFNFLSFFIVDFFITLFGTKLGPIIAVQVSNDKTVKKLISTLLSQQKDIEYAGFVIGSILGASASTIPSFLIEKLKRSTSRRVIGTNDPEIHFSKEVFLSQNFYKMFGALIGIVGNVAARHGANIALKTIITKYATSKFGTPGGAGQGGEMVMKMLLGGMMKPYDAFMSTFVRPKFPSDKPKDVPAKQESSTSSLEPLKKMLIRELSGQLLDGRVPLDNPIVKNLMEWYLGTSEQKETENKSLIHTAYSQYKKYREMYDGAIKKLEDAAAPTVEKVYPSENRSWHGWSTTGAQYFTSRWAKQYEEKKTSTTSPLEDKDVQRVLRNIRDIMDGVTGNEGLRSRL